VELAVNLAGRVLGMATGDVDSQNAEPQSINFDVLDRKIYVMSVPKDWDIFKPQGLFGGTTAIQPGHTEGGTQPTSAATFGCASQLEPSSTGVSSGEAVSPSGFDACSLPETGWPLEPLIAVSPSLPPSAPAPPPYPAALPDSTTSGHDPAQSWATDDWLAWYGSISPLWQP